MLLEFGWVSPLVLIRILRDHWGEEGRQAETFRRACRTDQHGVCCLEYLLRWGGLRGIQNEGISEHRSSILLLAVDGPTTEKFLFFLGAHLGGACVQKV